MRNVLFVALVLLAAPVQAQVYTRFGPANGILVGDASTYQTTAADATDVISLWSGSCSASNFLRGDGACGLPSASQLIAQFSGTCDDTTFLRGDGECAEAGSGGGASPANPTATVGLTAVNGTADTFMRSDAAPPLDLSIAPTWTGTHTFNNQAIGTKVDSLGVFLAQSTFAAYGFNETDASEDNRLWRIVAEGEELHFQAGTDGLSFNSFIDVARTGNTINQIDLSANKVVVNVPPDADAIVVTNGVTSVSTQTSSGGGGWFGTTTDHNMHLMQNNTTKLALTAAAVTTMPGIALQQNFTNVCLQDGTNCQATLASGTYTPTTTNVDNVSGSFANSAQYMRVGNVVTVSGIINGTAGGAGAVVIGMSLPIASNISADEHVAGVATSSGAFGIVNGDSANDRALFVFNANAAGGFTMRYQYTYRIL